MRDLRPIIGVVLMLFKRRATGGPRRRADARPFSKEWLRPEWRSIQWAGCPKTLRQAVRVPPDASAFVNPELSRVGPTGWRPRASGTGEVAPAQKGENRCVEERGGLDPWTSAAENLQEHESWAAAWARS